MKHSDVWNVCKKIPKGKVTTYGEIARALDTKAYRWVGQALKANPYAIIVPCHRVIRSNGEIGGFMGKNKKNIEEKIKLLKKEGIEIINNKINLNKYKINTKKEILK